MRQERNRRGFLKTAGTATLVGFGSAALPRGSSRATTAAAPAVVGTSNLAVKTVDRTWIDLPYKPVPKKHMERERADYRIRVIHRITLANGVVGLGESDGRASSHTTRVVGRSAAESMWDDSVGVGLQMALFDAVAKSNDVPIHRLLGPKQRDRAFLSWWACDMPGEDWVSECKEAVSQGYTTFKAKARPWFDLDEQCRTLTSTLPEHFKIDFDFNGFLLNTTNAVRYCVEIEKHPQVGIYETPIPQDDVAGNKFLRAKTRVPIAMHYGIPPIMTTLREEVCDGFVIGRSYNLMKRRAGGRGGASELIELGTVAATAGKPFWLQQVGSGLRATFDMHLAAVLTHARWSAINLHHVFREMMIRPAIKVENGTAAIPDGPGLGVELDEDALERCRIEPLEKLPDPPPDTLLAIRWPSGATSYYATAVQYRQDFQVGRLPVFPTGVSMEPIPNDGSGQWKELQARAQKGGVHLGGRLL